MAERQDAQDKEMKMTTMRQARRRHRNLFLIRREQETEGRAANGEVIPIVIKYREKATNYIPFRQWVREYKSMLEEPTGKLAVILG
jgi:hypothetical protein